MTAVSQEKPTVLVGTASWQEPDFIEYWYPKGLPKTKLLPYYSERFNFVEVNGTFYGIPLAKTTAEWCKQTPKEFKFSVKLHRLLSRHATEAKFLPADLRPKAEIVNGHVELTAKMEKLVAKKFIAGLEPLMASGKLFTLLLQLSPSFRPKTNSLVELDNILSLFADFSLAVELRNRFWLHGEQTEATVQFFKQRKVTLVSVDAPESDHLTVMPNIDFVTNPNLSYFRLHGRNAEAYVKGRTVQERFDYNYTLTELINFSKRVTGIADRVRAILVVFNNNRHRFAPDAALRFMQVLIEREKQMNVSKPQAAQTELL